MPDYFAMMFAASSCCRYTRACAAPPNVSRALSRFRRQEDYRRHTHMPPDVIADYYYADIFCRFRHTYVCRRVMRRRHSCRYAKRAIDSL